VKLCAKVHRLAREQEGWELRRQKQRSGMGNVQEMNTAFGVFVAINSLRQGCTLLAQKALANVSVTVPYLQEFQAYLPPKERENIFKYNLATFYFRKKDYQQALTLLPYVELGDILENFDSRRMLLLMYFERKEWQALTYLLDSFGIYLQRHKEGGYHREMYLNLVRFLKKMLAQPMPNEDDRRHFRTEIMATTHLAEREWLLSVI